MTKSNAESKNEVNRQLELFYDGELTEHDRIRLAGRLRSDPDLRRRLTTVADLDRRIGCALATHTTRQHICRRPGRFAVITAGALMLAIATFSWPTDARNVVEQGEAYDPIRVVVAIPARARPARVRPAVPGEGDSSTRVHPREHEAVAIAGTPTPAIAAPLSAEVAEKILDGLEPRDQLELCRHWIAAPGLRPVVFSKLATLAKKTAFRNEWREFIVELSSDRTCLSWLKGYRIIG